MARVPQHFRDKLISSRTGVNTLDTSAADSARAIGQMASSFQKVAQVEMVKQKREKDAATQTMVMSSFSNDYLQTVENTRRDSFEDPENFNELLAPKLEELKQKHLEGLSAREQADLGIAMEGFIAEGAVANTAWQIKQTTVLTQQKHLDRINQDAQYLSEIDTPDAYEGHFLLKMRKLEEDAGAFTRAFGVEEAQETLQKGKDSLARGFVTGLVNKGKIFEAEQVLRKPSVQNMVSATTQADLGELVGKARKGEKEHVKFKAAAQTVVDLSQHEEDIISGDVELNQLEEKLNQTSFELARLRKTEGVESTRIETAQKKLQILEALRDAELEQVDLRAKADPDTMGALKAKFLDLVDNNTLTGTVESLLNFKRDLAEARKAGTIDMKNYKKWQTATALVVNRDVLNKMGESKDRKLSFKGDLSNTNMKRRMNELLTSFDANPQGKETAMSALEFYLDEVNDRTQGSETDLLGDAAHEEILKNAKAKAQLKTLGFPVYLTAGDNVQIMNRGYVISGFDYDGMPLFKVGK